MRQKQFPRLTAPVKVLAGVGPGTEKKLAQLGINTIRDLLFHLPYRYIDRTAITPLGGLVPGRDFLVQGNIELTQIKFGKRRSLLCRISDGTGALTLRFFHFSQTQQAGLAKGNIVRCWGQVRSGPGGLEMIHPEYQRLSENERENLEQTLTPVYPATEGLTQIRLRKLSGQALDILAGSTDHPEELIPEDLVKRLGLPSLREALLLVHRPPPDADLDALKRGDHPSQKRLVFEELLAYQLSLRVVRKQIQSFQAPPLIRTAHNIVNEFIRQLPFKLTGAQIRVWHDIRRDLRASMPMLRLIQGDVGSGKTVVAALAALHTLGAGFQVALMAPTELLAEQHFQNLKQWFSSLDIPLTLLSGKLRNAERRKALELIAADQPLVAVGTHALFQEKIVFGKLGLAIIDEQHRFGVHQRKALVDKGMEKNYHPHQLIMTATPIPRTLAMSIYAELDVSVIDELPPGRKPVVTSVLSNQKRDELIERISAVCREGHQVYWVCTLIEESDVLQCQTATDTHAYLSEILPDLNVGLIHGRLNNSEKQRVMQEFKSGKIDMLIATTVIEVGVDVPNASLMVIENAERLGLSQLHQLRGRVGRGPEKSNCILLYQPPLNDFAQARLEVMRSTSDGFIIAEKDLELRGPGDLLGTRQTGLPEMRVANLVRDAKLIPQVQKAATVMLDKYPDKINALLRRWLASRLDYSKV